MEFTTKLSTGNPLGGQWAACEATSESHWKPFAIPVSPFDFFFDFEYRGLPTRISRGVTEFFFHALDVIHFHWTLYGLPLMFKKLSVAQ